MQYPKKEKEEPDKRNKIYFYTIIYYPTLLYYTTFILSILMNQAWNNTLRIENAIQHISRYNILGIIRLLKLEKVIQKKKCIVDDVSRTEEN